MSYIVEVREKKFVKVGERYNNSMPSFSQRNEVEAIMDEQITNILRQEVETLDMKELVKLLNKIV